MKMISVRLLLLAVILTSCHDGTLNTNKCGLCPAITAIFMAMKVKIVSKSTGADLFLSPTSPYKLSDLKVSSTYGGIDPTFTVDTMDASNRFVWLPDGGPASVTYTIQLANLSADHIKVVDGPTSQKCCPTTEIKSIMLNDSLICAPCGAQQPVIIRK